MKTTKFIVSISLFTTVLFSCVSSKYSNKTKGEKLMVKVNEDANYLALNKLRFQPVAEFEGRDNAKRGVGIGDVISLGIMGVNKLIEMDRSQFTASYQQSINEVYFYDQISKKGPFDPTGLQFKGFEIARNVKIKKKDTTAFSAAFEIDPENTYEILNGSVFRLRIKDLKLIYSKAKASRTRWYIPWSWGNKKDDNKMNMDINIDFYTSYATGDGKLMDNVKIGHFNLNLRDMPLDPKDKNYNTYYEKLKNQRLGGYSFIVPRSFGYSVGETGELVPAYNQGNYHIEISVKETGKEKFIKKILADNSAQIMKEGSGQAIKLIEKIK